MMTMTCAEHATEAYLRPRSGDRRPQMDDVEALASYRVFSNRHLEAITGLDELTVASITRKTDHTGGRLNVETLPLIARLEDDWENGIRNEHLVRLIVARGTSRGMLAKLTSIPLKDLDRMATRR